MRTIKVNQGQNLLDIALQEYGSTEGVINLVFDNSLDINSPLAGGDELVIDDNKVINAEVVKYYIDRKLKPNTGEPPPQEDLSLGIFDDSFDSTFE